MKRMTRASRWAKSCRRALAFAAACLAATGLIQIASESAAWALWKKSGTPLWPGGQVPYCFTQRLVNDPLWAVNGTTFSTDFVADANRWANVARIDFTPFSICPATCNPRQVDHHDTALEGCPAGTFVVQLEPGAFSSSVGYRATQPTVLYVSLDGPDFWPYALGHEIGHALGFEHEQDRNDNSGVDDATGCPSGVGSVPDAQDHLGTTFDRASIMSYCTGSNGELTQRDVQGAKAAYGPRTSIGVFRDGTWFLDANGNGVWDWADYIRSFGQAGDQPVAVSSRNEFRRRRETVIGVFRDGAWYLDSNNSGGWDSEDSSWWFGTSGDRPVVGAWNLFLGIPSSDNIGVLRGGSEWFLDNDRNRWWTGEPADVHAFYGLGGNSFPVVGDWNGNGNVTMGGFISGIWILDIDGNQSLASPDVVDFFGDFGDIPIVGDWNGDGRDKIGVFRNGQFLLDFNGNGTFDPDPDYGDLVLSFGQAGDLPVVGNFTPTRPDAHDRCLAGCESERQSCLADSDTWGERKQCNNWYTECNKECPW